MTRTSTQTPTSTKLQLGTTLASACSHYLRQIVYIRMHLLHMISPIYFLHCICYISFSTLHFLNFLFHIVFIILSQCFCHRAIFIFHLSFFHNEFIIMNCIFHITFFILHILYCHILFITSPLSNCIYQNTFVLSHLSH